MFRNKVTEADIREWLDKNGYLGRTAKFGEIELHAIRPPGWLQLFRFDCKVKCNDGQPNEMWGWVRDEESRTVNKTEIQVFENAEDRNKSLALLSRETAPGGDSKANWLTVVFAFGLCTFLILVVLLIRSLGR